MQDKVVAMRTIFAIVNEENAGFTISDYLVREGFRVETFSNVEEMVLRLQAGYPDMFILDIPVSARVDIEFCKSIAKRSGLPLIFITAGARQEASFSWIPGKEFYLAKTFSPRELVAQVRAIFRRAPSSQIPEEILRIGNLSVNPNERHTVVDSRDIMLTPMEYELLLLLAQQPHRTFNRQELLDRIWGYDYVGDERAVDNLVKRLRKKLREHGSNKNVKTVWGCGYRFED